MIFLPLLVRFLEFIIALIKWLKPKLPGTWILIADMLHELDWTLGIVIPFHSIDLAYYLLALSCSTRERQVERCPTKSSLQEPIILHSMTWRIKWMPRIFLSVELCDNPETAYLEWGDSIRMDMSNMKPIQLWIIIESLDTIFNKSRPLVLPIILRMEIILGFNQSVGLIDSS